MPGSRLVVLASGNGSNLQAIIDACADGRLPAGVAAVVSDQADAYALARAGAAGIPSVHVGRNPGEARADAKVRAESQAIRQRAEVARGAIPTR